MFQTKEYEYLYQYYCNKIDQRPVDYKLTGSDYENFRLNISEPSGWICHWADMQYIPSKNNVPSWFARRMTEYFFGCKWTRK